VREDCETRWENWTLLSGIKKAAMLSSEKGTVTWESDVDTGSDVD
jgi:hypothetical protein